MSIRTRRSPAMDNNRPRSMDPSTLEALASSLRDLNEDYTMSSYRPRMERRSLARADAVTINTSSATGTPPVSTTSADSSSGTASPLPSRAMAGLGPVTYTGPSSNTAAQYVVSGSSNYANPSSTSGQYVGTSSGYSGSNAPYSASTGVSAYVSSDSRARAASPYTTSPATVYTVKPVLEKKSSRDGSNAAKTISRQSSLGSFPDKYTFNDEKQASTLVSGLKELYKQKQLVDVVLCVEDEEFPCHRCVLASSSPYFHAMFTADLVESRQEKIRIGVVDAISMRLILDYAYTATLEITEGNVQGLMLAVNMFQMHNLRDACAHFLERHVTLSNCIGIYFFAVAHACIKLEGLAIDMISENFTEVCKEEEFLQLSKERLIDLLVRDDLNVDQEETVYEAAIAWVRDDLENRRADLYDVLSNVRFALISPYYIHDVVERDRLIVHNKSVQHLVDAALQYHVLRDRRQDLDLTKLNINPRKGMPIKDMFVFLTHHTEAIPETWTTDLYRIKPLPDMIEHAECVVSGENNLFVAGRSPQEFTGRRFAQRRGGLFQYDHFDKKWLPRGTMNVPRNYFSMAVLDGMIYVTGGVSNDVVQESVECYNTNTNIWRNVTPMLQAAKSHCLATVGGKLYVIGGETNESILDTVQCYNPRFDTWNYMTSMTLPRTSAGVAVLNREIYVLGGSVALGEKQPENMLKSVEIFHPDRNEWRFGPELPEGKVNYGAVTHNGKLYVFGGDTGEEAAGVVHSKVYRLDIDNFVWVEDKSGWPNLQPPFYCVMARLNKNM
ncbi:kelch-like protein 2 [Acanthaster planci]|uniref:Kelch-like protein 2 n=1 Tax=Acanthaster planci TaxID=133434 RepID=A0A8B7ZSW6_ACAPL|nr:kelch-like protein 2 [Acanthaster planci]